MVTACALVVALEPTVRLESAVVPPTAAPKLTAPPPAVMLIGCAPLTVEVPLKLTVFPALLPVSVIVPPPAPSSTGPVKLTPAPAVFTVSVPFSVVEVAAV